MNVLRFESGNVPLKDQSGQVIHELDDSQTGFGDGVT